ncbi:TetR family transcriptional regulator [Rhodanobacter sp. B05]|uniref:TetR/AcrR family transcriptional regulator n=1 Tax=Rhodanobacter sp. B05 TaxID=1945859 RepID=UPI000984FC85|nr:TetR/AcrR family transcriptional regulator [Rhodanobacter sp. B05]OOG61195.1 TetR family transcriptional regulator [Rhodanobacter sp. B05]
MSRTQRTGHGDTRKRLLEATEWLFIESGYEAMSLRHITARASANLAAVNYHFGSKEALMQEVLAQRLDRLNRERLQLLSACEQEQPAALDAAAVLAMLFIPAFRLSHGDASGPAFMRLLGRVYSDPSPFIRSYLEAHYRPISGRFFEAFSRALPALPRRELGLRLHFALKALSGMLAGEDMQALIASVSQGQEINDTELLARLVSLLVPILTAPFGTPEQIDVIERVLKFDSTSARTSAETPVRPEHDPSQRSTALEWLKEGRLAS